MRKTLTSLILLTLVIAAFAVFSPNFSLPCVKAQDNQATVLTYSWYLAPNDTAHATYPGDLVAVGEIQNTGSTNIGTVQVVGIAYDSKGTALAYANANAYVYTSLSPSQKAPFYIDFSPVITGLDQSWEASVSNVTVYLGGIPDPTQTQYSSLTLSSSGKSTVTGSVKNTGSQATGNLWVEATFYNSSGTVVGVAFTNYISHSLQPGESASFTLTPFDSSAIASTITSSSLLVQSMPLSGSSTPTPSGSTTTPHPTTSSQPTSSPASSSSTQSPIALSFIIIAVIVAAIVVVIVVLVVTMLLFRRRRKSTELPPPPPPPPPPPA